MWLSIRGACSKIMLAHIALKPNCSVQISISTHLPCTSEPHQSVMTANMDKNACTLH